MNDCVYMYLYLVQVFKQSGPNQPSSDIIRPNSQASVSLVAPVLTPTTKKMEDFFGPLGNNGGGTIRENY